MPAGRVRLKPDATTACAERSPDQSGVRLQPDQPFVRPPHDYGVAVILLSMADWTCSGGAGARRYARPSARYLTHRHSTATSTRTRPRASSTRSRCWRKRCASRRRRCCATSTSATWSISARALLPLIGSYGSDPALSESRSPKPAAPVFLLHGVDDNVIPSIESAVPGRRPASQGPRPAAPQRAHLACRSRPSDARERHRAARVVLGDLLSRWIRASPRRTRQKRRTLLVQESPWPSVRVRDHRGVALSSMERLQKILSQAGVASRRASGAVDARGPRHRERRHRAASWGRRRIRRATTFASTAGGSRSSSSTGIFC